MPVVSVPALVAAGPDRNIADYVVRWAQRQPDRVMLSVREAGAWRDLTAGELRVRVVELAKGFLAAGIGAGDRVAIMSRTRAEWTLADLALWTVGAVPVPVHPTSPRGEVSWVLRDSGAVALIVEDAAMRATVSAVRGELPRLNDVLQIDSGSLEELASAGAELGDEVVEERRTARDRTDLATIVYTSGTTGRPRGCELTHDNLMALCENAAERLSAVVRQPGCATLLAVPLASVLGRVVQVLALYSGARLGHTPDAAAVLDDLATFRPTFLVAAPRDLERTYNAAERRAAAGGRGGVVRSAAQVAIAYSRALDRGGPGPVLRLRHAAADRLALVRLRRAMGGQLRHALSGGAALGERLGHLYRGAGVVVLEGYGLTEAAAPVTVNTPDMMKIGTVGRPLPGVAVRVEDDGHVLVRGVGVFRGYHGDPEATASAVRQGWLRTGDLGSLDDDGFLRIAGRARDVLLTSGGRTVSPAPLEDRLREHPLVSQCVVVGHARPFVGALVALDADMLAAWASRHGLDGLTPERARTHPAVRAEIQRAVDEANRSTSRAESIRTFVLLDEDFTVTNGLLTPSSQLRRSRVGEVLGHRIEELYTS